MNKSHIIRMVFFVISTNILLCSCAIPVWNYWSSDCSDNPCYFDDTNTTIDSSGTSFNSGKSSSYSIPLFHYKIYINGNMLSVDSLIINSIEIKDKRNNTFKTDIYYYYCPFPYQKEFICKIDSFPTKLTITDSMLYNIQGCEIGIILSAQGTKYKGDLFVSYNVKVNDTIFCREKLLYKKRHGGIKHLYYIFLFPLDWLGLI